MAAPPSFVVRDALAVCVILTRGFALVEAQAFAGGLREVYLSRVGITFGIRTGRNESTRQAYRSHEFGEGIRQYAMSMKCNTYSRFHIHVRTRHRVRV